LWRSLKSGTCRGLQDAGELRFAQGRPLKVEGLEAGSNLKVNVCADAAVTPKWGGENFI
jgi:hypothetical protein